MANYNYTLLISKYDPMHPVTHIIRSTITTSQQIKNHLDYMKSEWPGEWGIDDWVSWFGILPEDCEVIDEREFGKVWY